MKKILLTLALAAFAMTANAQWVLGGSINVSHDNWHMNDYVTGTTTNSFSIMPKVGYQLNEKMQIGAQVGWKYNYIRNYTSTDTYTSSSATGASGQPTIIIAPYLRYNFANWKNFTVFAEAHLTLGLHLESSNYASTGSVTTNNGDQYTTFAISVVPGLNYAVTDKISLDLYINLLNCYAEFMTSDVSGGHEYGIGINMNNQSLFSQLSNFSLGFNYHF